MEISSSQLLKDVTIGLKLSGQALKKAEKLKADIAAAKKKTKK
jgi:hypothetical protein